MVTEVSVCGAATVDVDGTSFGKGPPDIASVEGCCIEKDRCPGGTDEVLRRPEIVRLKRKSVSGLRCAGQDAEGVRRVIYIC